MRSASHALKLREANRLLARRYGTPTLGNKRDPVSELVFIILSARTRGRSHEAAYRALRRKYRTWEATRDARARDIARAIKDAGLSRIKARQIKSLLKQITSDWGSLRNARLRELSTPVLEEYLCQLPGVGLKTARCVLMYALDRKVFPVDTHCIRLFQHLAIIGERPRFEHAQDLLQPFVPPSIRKTLHVNVVAHGRETCVPRAERCDICVIAHLCQRKKAP